MFSKFDPTLIPTGLFILIGLACLGAVLIACQEPYPTDSPPSFVGTWAGNWQASPEYNLLITFRVNPDHTYRTVITSGPDTVTRESGKWDADAATFRTKPIVCEDGSPLHLVSCSEDWDSMPVNITGGVWTVHFLFADQVQDLELRRIE